MFINRRNAPIMINKMKNVTNVFPKEFFIKKNMKLLVTSYYLVFAVSFVIIAFILSFISFYGRTYNVWFTHLDLHMRFAWLGTISSMLYLSIPFVLIGVFYRSSQTSTLFKFLNYTVVFILVSFSTLIVGGLNAGYYSVFWNLFKSRSGSFELVPTYISYLFIYITIGVILFVLGFYRSESKTLDKKTIAYIKYRRNSKLIRNFIREYILLVLPRLKKFREQIDPTTLDSIVKDLIETDIERLEKLLLYNDLPVFSQYELIRYTMKEYETIGKTLKEELKSYFTQMLLDPETNPKQLSVKSESVWTHINKIILQWESSISNMKSEK